MIILKRTCNSLYIHIPIMLKYCITGGKILIRRIAEVVCLNLSAFQTSQNQKTVWIVVNSRLVCCDAVTPSHLQCCRYFLCGKNMRREIKQAVFCIHVCLCVLFCYFWFKTSLYLYIYSVNSLRGVCQCLLSEHIVHSHYIERNNVAPTRQFKTCIPRTYI